MLLLRLYNATAALVELDGVQQQLVPPHHTFDERGFAAYDDSTLLLLQKSTADQHAIAAVELD